MATKKTGTKRSAASGQRPKAQPAAAKSAKKKPRGGGLKVGSISASLTVDDLGDSIAFYCEVLGFSVSQKWEMDGVLRGVELEAGDVCVMLAQDDWKKGRKRKKGEGLRFYLTTKKNIDKLADKLKLRGLKLDQEPMTTEWGRHFAFHDPDGFKFTIAKEAKSTTKKK